MRSLSTIRGYRLLPVLLLVLASSALGGEVLSWKTDYDSLGRVAATFDPSGKATRLRYEFDSEGSLTLTSTSADSRVIERVLSSEALLQSMNDDLGTESYSYDSYGRLTRVDRVGGHPIQVGYNEVGDISELSVGDFYEIKYTYDFLNRVASVSTPAGVITYEYQSGQGTVIRSLPNGVKTFHERQPTGQLVSITHGLFNNPDDTRYTVLAIDEYGHDANDRLARVTSSTQSANTERSYAYDALGRLVGAVDQAGLTVTYEYDELGNRTAVKAAGETSQSCTYDWAGRVRQVNGMPCKYDSSGSLIEVVLDGIKREYTYRDDGRITGARSAQGDVRYVYDGNGRLAKRLSSSGEIRFVCDPLSSIWQPLVMETGDGSRTLIVWDGLSPLAMVRDGHTEWLLEDHLGSVCQVVDANGSVVRHAKYDPFGTIVSGHGYEPVQPAFAGLFWDSEAGVYLTLARAYAPELGCFLQIDPQKRLPTGDAEALSIYSYCGGDPVNWVDLNGASRKQVESKWYQRWILDPLWDLNIGDPLKYVATPLYNLTRPSGNERDDVVGQIVSDAWTQARSDVMSASRNGGPSYRHDDVVTKAHEIAKRWRYDAKNGGNEYSTWCRDNGRTEINTTAHEFRTAEHYWVTRRRIETGTTLVRPAVSPGRRALREFEKVDQGWNVAKVVGQWGLITPGEAQDLAKDHSVKSLGSAVVRMASRLPLPGLSENKIRNTQVAKEWLPDTKRNVKWTERAKQDAIGMHYGMKAHQTRIDEFHRTTASSVATGSSVSRWGSGSGYNRWDNSFDRPRSVEPDRRRDVYASDIKYGSGFPPSPPTPVGGVYLGGASDMIEDIKNLKGATVDKNGNIVLISESDESIQLPPLRVDDIVTVFRSVYLHGEGPSVTIDPNPEDPENSAMIVRHGAATSGTYVGWVLFQADRLMKSYLQGIDNVTEQDVDSKIAGYKSVLDTVYFGAGDPRQKQREGIWERFWIVPASTDRFEGMDRLAVFDIPLRVKTQKMKWRDGDLVDDKSEKSSIGAQSFTNWFTSNYEKIAAEQYLKPPKGSGMTEPVPVFQELQRVALLTAIAEKLRGDGVPMPFWMHYHKIRPVEVEQFTPGMEVTWTRRWMDALQTARMFGGVQLSQEPKKVRTFSKAKDITKAPVEKQAEIKRQVELARELEPMIIEALPSVAAKPMKTKEMVLDEVEFVAVQIPGATTRALDACRIRETDLLLETDCGKPLALSRSFNSFFDPEDIWGDGWTLDLPELVELKIVVDRNESEATFSVGVEVITPLNSINARFVNGVPVVDFSTPDEPNEDPQSLFEYMAEEALDELKGEMFRMLKLKDGRKWYFTKGGGMIAERDGPSLTVYERDGKGRISGIAMSCGGAFQGRIKLDYNNKNLLSKATGKLADWLAEQALEVEFEYNESGRLEGVSTESGTRGYSYDGPLVSEVIWRDASDNAVPEPLIAYEYNENGQLLSERGVDVQVARATSIDDDGLVSKVQFSLPDDTSGLAMETTTRYDGAMRPIESVDSDSVTTRWRYGQDGSVRTTVDGPGLTAVEVIRSGDGQSVTLKEGDMPTVTATLDDAGRVVALAEESNDVLQQTWRQDGQLAQMKTPTTGTSFSYSEHGLLESVLAHPPGAEGSISEWRQTSVDHLGRPVEITDYAGLKVYVNYDSTGNVSGVVQATGAGNLGYNIARDDSGRITNVSSSWGTAEYLYDQDGDLDRVIQDRAGNQAILEFTDGALESIVGFDGSEAAITYMPEGDAEGLPASVKISTGLELVYSYDAEGRPTEVRMGDVRGVRIQYDTEGRLVSYEVIAL